MAQFNKVPDDVRKAVSFLVSEEATREGWLNLADADKAKIYFRWAKDSKIGNVLTGFMGPQEVHRYLKDTIIKNYVIRQMEDPTTTLAILNIPAQSIVQEKWVKPHGLAITGVGIIAWSAAQEWKTTLIAVHERAVTTKIGKPYAAVLYNAYGKFADASLQAMANDIARRLDIEIVRWIS